MTHQSFHISNVLPAGGIGEGWSFEVIEGIIREQSANSGAQHVLARMGTAPTKCPEF